MLQMYEQDYLKIGKEVITQLPRYIAIEKPKKGKKRLQNRHMQILLNFSTHWADRMY